MSRKSKKRNPLYQPSIIRYPTGKYSFVGSLPESLCDMSDPKYPRPYKFQTYQGAVDFAKKHGFIEDPNKSHIGGLIQSKRKKNPSLKSYAKGRWYVLYASRGQNYQVYVQKLVGGWEWSPRLSDGKAFGSYATAKRVYNDLWKKMIMPGGAALTVAVEEEAKSLL